MKMKTISIASLAALLLVLAWQFNIQLLLERMLDWIQLLLERMLDWIASLGAMPRVHYP